MPAMRKTTGAGYGFGTLGDRAVGDPRLAAVLAQAHADAVERDREKRALRDSLKRLEMRRG